MRPASVRKLSVLFHPEDVARIAAFLDRDGGFSLAGEMAIVEMIEVVQGYASLEQILEGCEREWINNWLSQHPSVRANPGLNGRMGTQNFASVEMFYFAFRVPSSLISTETEIPFESFAVRTRNSIYRFGETDLNGWRTVSRDSADLAFTRGKILYLGVGKSMTIEYLHDPRHALRHHTTPVLEFQGVDH